VAAVAVGPSAKQQKKLLGMQQKLLAEGETNKWRKNQDQCGHGEMLLMAKDLDTATVAMVPPQQQPHDIADVIETCVAAPTEQSVEMASIALYRHERAHGDDPGMSILQDALESAKRVCRENGIV
jgi:hypothetical protein